jgi:integrase/recombinase XerD
MNTKKRAVSPDFTRAIALKDAYDDYILSRKAKMVRPGTLGVYQDTIEKFIKWMIGQGKDTVDQLTAREVREFLNGYIQTDHKPNYVNLQARNIRAFVKFLAREDYIPKEIRFEIPPKTKDRQLCLNEEQLGRVLGACETPRDRALVMVLADSGLRAAEALSLNWGNIDVNTGIIFLPRGKGGKPRSTRVGAKTCKAILAYRRTVCHAETDPFAQTYSGERLQYFGLRMMFERLSKRSGEKVTAHSLRRTFATLSLRAGMDPVHLQALMGHTTLSMTTAYIQLVDGDIMQAHKEHGPLDKWLSR